MEGKMAVDYYLELDGIDGESQDKDHKDKINIESWSWGMSQSGTTHLGTGSGAGKVNVQDLSLTKIIDKSSTVIMKHCTTGKHISSGKLHCYKASGDSRVKYLELEMKNILVSSYQSGGSGGDQQMESFSLNFGEYKMTYTQQMADGSAGPAVDFGWKIPVNESW
jgi:type VI secretion system secreted protein Hcp